MKKRILALAIPATIENVLQVLVGFLDTFIISRLGLLIVSAVGLANTYINLFIAIFTAIGIGASSMISRMFGAKRLDDAQKEANQSVSIALLVGLIFSVITGVFSTQLMNLLTRDTDTVNQASLFLRIVGGGSVFISLSIVFGSILRSTGDTKTPMKIGVITNILNVVLDILLVFGLKWGVVGTAIGTVVARLVATVYLYFAISKTAVSIDFFYLFRMRRKLTELESLMLTSAAERSIMKALQIYYFSVINSLGSIVFAAHSIVGTIESVAYLPVLGLSTATTVLVGNAIGQEDYKKAKLIQKDAIVLGIISQIIAGLVLYFGAKQWALLFTQDPEAIDQIVIALKICALILVPLTVQMVTTGALHGMGDMKAPLFSTIVGMVLIRIVGVLTIGIQFGLAGVWYSILIDIIVRAIYLVYRFNKNLSKKAIL